MRKAAVLIGPWEREPMPAAGATVPMFCAMCHGAVTLQFIGGWLEANLKQSWACPYCSQTNADGFPYRLAWVTKDHEALGENIA